MSEWLAILAAAGLFGLFGLAFRGRQQALHCGGCGLKQADEVCEACPHPASRD